MRASCSLAVCVASVLALAAPASAAPSGSPQVVTAGLAVPWEVLSLPDGRVLVSERSEKRVRTIVPGGGLRAEPAWSEPAATKVLGMALHPDYATNRLIYVYVTYSSGSKVLRLVDDGAQLRTDRVIFDGPIRTDGNHDGGRIAFGPDGKLYVTTGDVHDPALPRDLSKLNGKILRLNADGSAPADNPFAARTDDGRYVWSFGHRHPQGLAWDATGRLWASEHGPSGESYAPAGEKSGNDEVNLIVKGGDYGWPQSSGAVVQPGTRAPAYVAGDAAVAPGGLVFAPDGRLYVPMLAGKHLRALVPQGDTLVDEGPLFPGTRLRAASMVGCELWFTTDMGADEVRRVAIAPCGPSGAGAPTPGAPPTAGAPPTNAPPTSAVPVAPTPDPNQPTRSARPLTSTTVALDRLLARAQAEARRLGLRRLSARRSFTVRGGGFPRGSLAVRVRIVRPDRSVTLAAGRRGVASRSMVGLGLDTTRAGRAAARRAASARVQISVSHRPTGGAVRTRSRVVTVRRAATR